MNPLNRIWIFMLCLLLLAFTGYEANAGCIGQGCGEPGSSGTSSYTLDQYQVMNFEGITYAPSLGSRSYGLQFQNGSPNGDACVIDGVSDGPMIRSVSSTAAVYECNSEDPSNPGFDCPTDESIHCGTGGSCQACPTNCGTSGYNGYHTTAAFEFDRAAQTSFLGVTGKEWGDGISQTITAAGTSATADSAPMNVYGADWTSIFDDLFECDWGCDMNIDQVFADSVKMVVAQHCRSNGTDACPQDFSSYTVKLSNSFFHLVGRQDPVSGLPTIGAFKNGYKQKVGSGGMFKFMKAEPHNGDCPSGSPHCNPAVTMTGVTIYAGPKLMDDDQLLFPPLDTMASYDNQGTPTDFSDDTVSPTDCNAVTLYWNGTDDELDTALSKSDEYGDDYLDDSTWNNSVDGAVRRNVLDNARTGDYPGYSPCLTVVVRCAGSACDGAELSEANFYGEARTQRYADWLSWGF